MPNRTRIALKVDVDTFQGTRHGVPALLEELERAGVRASFYLTLGPDRSGMAVLRVFRKRGFLAKMLRTNPARMYGWRTMLYGTVLPAPQIGARLSSTLREIAERGHDIGLHAWDHVRWQDDLDRLNPAEIAAELERGVQAFESIFARRPSEFAAPAWFTTPTAMQALVAAGFEISSVSRARTGPFQPMVEGEVLPLIEVPTSLPTLDEALGREGVTRANWNDHLLSCYREGATEVLTIHAETEGMAFREEFRDLLERHHALGIEHVTVREAAKTTSADKALPKRALTLGEVPGRAGLVSVPATDDATQFAPTKSARSADRGFRG